MSKNLVIEYGRFTFTGEAIKDVSELTETDLLGASIPVPSLSVSVRCDDPTILNYTVNDPIVFKEGGRKRGTYYIRDVERLSNDIYEIDAVDALEALANVQHHGGMYIGNDAITVNELCKSICGSIPCIIKGERPTDGTLEGVSEIVVRGWLPYQTARDNLAQVLLATGATAKSDLDGVIRIESFWTGQAWHTPSSEMYQSAKVKNEQRVTSVVVLEHQYYPGDETIELFDGNSNGDVTVTFNEPVHSLSWSGGKILESGANYAVLGPGSGKLTGKKYVHNTRRITRDVQTAPRPLEKTVEKATLISLYNSNEVADRLKEYYKHSDVIDCGMVNEYANAGNVVNVFYPYSSEQVTATVERDETVYSSTNQSKSKLRVGYKPPSVGNYRYEEFHEILTGSGTYNPPEYTTRIHAVLIGSGGGGSRGGYGRSVSGYTISRIDSESSASHSMVPGAKGGPGGSGGLGGTILEVDIETGDGYSAQYNCGAGGVGGSSSGNPVSGSETTFGGYSSDEGGYYQDGYTDIDLKVYGKAGGNGISGANGGDGGNVPSIMIPENGKNGGDTIYGSGGVGGSYYHYNHAGGLAGTSIGGSGGSGAADGRGINGRAIVRSHESLSEYAFLDRYSIYASAGVNGRAGSNAVNYGCGGEGGGGGSGAGGIGAFLNVPWSWSGNANYVEATAYGASGGTPGTGGDGADGCVIITGVKAIPMPAGTSVDAEARFEIDRYGRILAV